MAQRGTGDRPGKLLSDPAVWYPVNAILDGVDPFSDSPVERMRYMVYQRRSDVDTLKTKALLTAMINPERAAKAFEDYIGVVMPVSAEVIEARERERDRQVAEIDTMAPIGCDKISYVGGGSMRRDG